jgi:hypothetical protein
MELRSLQGCSPSFVSNCQIIYMGDKVVSKWDKLLKILPSSHINYSFLKDIFQDLFAKNLENIGQD